MKNILLSTLTLVCLYTNAQQKVETINNQTIIRLTKSKLPENIIIQKIKQSACNFDVSTDALINLKDNNVGDSVINLMIERQSKSDIVMNNQQFNNSNDKGFTFTESGIYFLQGNDYVSLDNTIVTKQTSTIGIFSASQTAQLEGNEANYQINNRRPEFYFNFEPVKKSLSDANANVTSGSNYLDQLFAHSIYANSGNAQAISPNEFELVKLNKLKKRRELPTGKVNMYKVDFSIDYRAIVKFKYKKVSAHTYKVYFENDIEAGEYCFIYKGNNSQLPYYYGQNNIKVFDFGIK